MKQTRSIVGAAALLGAACLGYIASSLTAPAGAQSGAVIFRDGQPVASTMPLSMDEAPAARVSGITIGPDHVLYRVWTDGTVDAFDDRPAMSGPGWPPRWQGWRAVQ